VFFHFAYRDLKAAISSKARYGGYKQEDANGGLPASDIASGSIVSLMNPETPDPADINASPAASACFLLFGSGFALSSTHDPARSCRRGGCDGLQRSSRPASSQ
jgi:hypothetical protein